MKKHFLYPLLIIIIGFLAWFKVLNFWFFKAYEATWLKGLAPHTLINLIRGHGFLYYLDLQIFGWNPWGWYLTALILHLVAGLILFKLVFRLSGNIDLAGITGLLFIANTAYHDVVTWGSFNSYYPLLLIFILLTIFSFDKFRRTQELKFFALSIILSFLTFFIRQTGLMVVLLVTLYDLVFYKPNLRDKKELFHFIRRQSFFYAAAAIFLILNSWYKGIPGDFADSNVKMRIRLIKDSLFLEYAKASLLTFGKLVPPHLIPYPLLNKIRELLAKFIDPRFLASYFFPLVGWLLFAILSRVAYSFRKSKEYFPLLLFSWFWLAGFTLFTSLAIPYTQEVLIREYRWITMRYCYFAFVGTVILLATLLVRLSESLKKILSEKKAERVLFLIVAGIVMINVFMLWKFEDQIYASTFKPGKEFYTQFQKEFPTLPEKCVFYIFPYTAGLNDYLFEWYYLRDLQYPNLAGQPYRIESQIEAILKKIKDKKVSLEDVFFLDYNQKEGLINKTAIVRDFILHQQEKALDFQRVAKGKSFKFTTSEFRGPPVETPYDLEILIHASFDKKRIGQTPNSQLFRALVDYHVERKEYLETVKLTTARTMSQREGEPFLFVLPENLIDGDLGPRSSWIVDAKPAWVMVDLGKEQEINAVAWDSEPNSTRIPATYSLLISSDGENWQIAKEVKNNSLSAKIDTFEKPLKTRFIKMDIHTTSLGEFVKLDEFEVIGAKGKKVLSFYSDRDKLFQDSLRMFEFVASEADLDYALKGLNFFWGKLTWETNYTSSLTHAQQKHFPYLVDGKEHLLMIKIPEAEIYSTQGQFLKKFINSITLDFGQAPLDIKIKSLKLVPRVKLSE